MVYSFLPVNIFLPVTAGKSFLPVNQLTGYEIKSLSRNHMKRHEEKRIFRLKMQFLAVIEQFVKRK